MHGSQDRIADVEGSRMLHDRAGSSDKTIRVYEGLYHEIMNEPEREVVLAELATWLDSRAEARGMRSSHKGGT
jgi:alpha-beta hydrolase superfamily lysophospholipase